MWKFIVLKFYLYASKIKCIKHCYENIGYSGLVEFILGYS
jgi:hypothetical protein